MIIQSDLAQRMQGLRTTATVKLQLSIWDVQAYEWNRRARGGVNAHNFVDVEGTSYYFPRNLIEVERTYTVAIIKSFPEGDLYGGAYVPRDDEMSPKDSAMVLHVPYRGMLIRWPAHEVELLKITTLCGHSVRAAWKNEVGGGARMCKMCIKKLPS
jgi:hypothetical protein